MHGNTMTNFQYFLEILLPLSHILLTLRDVTLLHVMSHCYPSVIINRGSTTLGGSWPAPTAVSYTHLDVYKRQV